MPFFVLKIYQLNEFHRLWKFRCLFFVNMLLRILPDNILMKLNKCKRYALHCVNRSLILVPEFPSVTRLFLDALFLPKIILQCGKILKN